ncbi:CocE/NonD family hydrolase [Ponticaulis sp.]|uniref:CocE/NonD family hydrolase n=1 Tax=Ponticaulis sp. TaxID=2020902 RepID=UPI000B6AD9C8|nr:CocE/NonD family hydrolase [Ponticaulis sp.]MAI90949.1 hypothetical protein [Ponticaulis sp.]OUX98291.1 MAG: hypothetical protein CBB65_10930 [Hyphomonadaceae bacterium TMED5]|tara:strand:- start:15294 stop:17111 length:1818 start_codon:yes stop_codon:yes gene_type:complete
MTFRHSLIGISAFALMGFAAQAEFTLPEGASVEENVQITMRDGARLNADIYLPASGGPAPTIYVRTPYDDEMSSRTELHQQLLESGYAIVEQHERGRYFSDGTYVMLGHSVEDGWDTMDWITAQDWSNGDIGTLGCSSSAEIQLQMAAAAHPAHRALVAQSAGVGVAEAGPFREQGNFWRGGIWQQGWMDYFLGSTVQNWPQLPEGLSDEERQYLTGAFELTNLNWARPKSEFDAHRMDLPMVEIAENMGGPQNELRAYIQAGPVDESWDVNRISEGEMIAVPGLWTEAIYDISSRSTTAYFDWNRQANLAEGRDNQVMRITQGSHCGFGRITTDESIGDLELGDMSYDYAAELLSWFNRWMMPDAETEPMQAAYTAYLSDGEWLAFDDAIQWGGETFALTADGELSTAAGDAGSITYLYDPADPVPSLGGEIGGTGTDHHDGSFDQTELEAREDVIVFTSEPLTEDIVLFGYAEIGLSVSSDAPDTDFTIKIIDVFPDGRAMNIGDSIQRMRYREGLETEVFMEEGEVYHITLPPVLLSRRIEAGHSLRVEVSSSNFPSYARNLNTDQDPYTSTDFAVAENTLHLGEGHASYISLPVIADPAAE